MVDEQRRNLNTSVCFLEKHIDSGRTSNVERIDSHTAWWSCSSQQPHPAAVGHMYRRKSTVNTAWSCKHLEVISVDSFQSTRRPCSREQKSPISPRVRVACLRMWHVFVCMSFQCRPSHSRRQCQHLTSRSLLNPCRSSQHESLKMTPSSCGDESTISAALMYSDCSNVTNLHFCHRRSLSFLA